jgi:hypothetical protein
MAIRFCQITSTKPGCVTKEFSLVDGELQKKTTANVYEGRMEIKEVSGANDFAELLQSLGPNQCLTYGIPPHDARLITEEEWLRSGQPVDALPRTKSVFAWPNGPGIFMLDYDSPKDGGVPYKRKELVSLVLKILPASARIALLWWPSTSSHIFSGEDELTGIGGQRIYILVEDATDIERAGNTLNEKLWALGHGRYEVSSSGSFLKRSVFDGSVWQANRIDFAAGAKCAPGLSQRRGEPRVVASEPSGFLDTRVCIPDLTEEEMTAALEHQNRCKSEVAEEAKVKRAEWIRKRVDEIRIRHPELSDQSAESVVRRAVETRTLHGEWLITVKRHDGSIEVISVKDALDDPETFHGLLTLDPLEPEYDGGRFVGKLYLTGSKPNIHSFAHGGANFRLRREAEKIELIAGKSREATDQLLTVLRNEPDLYDFGFELVQVGPSGSLMPLTESSLRYVAGGFVQFWVWRILRNGTCIDVLKDPPPNICRSVIELRELRQLKPLTGVITAPTLRPDGSLIAFQGYDPVTQLLYEPSVTAPLIPMSPTREEAENALEVIWKPFVDFPFCSALDRAVHLAALLTAAVRPVLQAAPGFAYDAPVQGSGKTLLARCIGVLAQGGDPGVWPHTAGRDDEEVRKRIFAVLRSGVRVLIWDNVVGAFDSAAMASLMTSPSLTDRILGQSVSSTVPNRMMLVLTGNNILLKGEMPRRILISRIDPATDKPFAREFDLEPFAYCQDNRQALIAAALTLIRAYLTHGCKTNVAGRLASFEDWDAWVRRTVIFCNELQPGMFADVMDSVKASQQIDPEQEALTDLLRELEDVMGKQAFTASEVVMKVNGFPLSESSKELKEALENIVGGRSGTLTAKSIGRAFGYRKDRIAGGRVLEHGPVVRDTKTWRVRQTE